MKNKQARKMIESVSGGNFVFDAPFGRKPTTGAVLWVFDEFSPFAGYMPDLDLTIKVNSKISLTADQLKGKQ